MAKALVLGSGAALPAKGRFNTTLAVLEEARTAFHDRWWGLNRVDKE